MWTRSKPSDWREVMHCILQYEGLFHICLCGPCISLIKHKLQQDTQLHYRTSIHHIIITIGIFLKNTISSSRVSIMNRYMVQPWVTPSIPLWPTCSWKKFETMAINMAPTPKALAQVCGWYLCHLKGRMCPFVPTVHQHHWPLCTIYCRDAQHWWIHALSGYLHMYLTVHF